jgi:hypothetical protein
MEMAIRPEEIIEVLRSRDDTGNIRKAVFWIRHNDAM